MVATWSTVATVLYAASLGGVYAAPTRNYAREVNLSSSLSGSLSALSGVGFTISDGCQNTLNTLMSSPAASCMNIPGTLAIITTVANSSWIPPTNNWLSNFCAAETCTNDQITATVGLAADGCTTELQSIGVTKEFVIAQAITYYPNAKQAVCLRDKNNNNDLCAITSLEALQTALGGQPLTPSVVQEKYQMLLDNNFALAKQLACTPCASAGFAIMRPVLPQEFLTTIDSFVGAQCGVDFTSLPTGALSVVTGTQAELAAQATAATGSSVSMRLSSHQSTILGATAGILGLGLALL